MDQWVRDVLRCPKCKGELEDLSGFLACPACQLAYPVQDGIPGLLEHRAVPLASVE
ncbi:MAG: Trm112 family protein [Bifidobacteriaceae bacterium]|nr:Trm112 family protein [Bifidobacteriaceae bacterium]